MGLFFLLNKKEDIFGNQTADGTHCIFSILWNSIATVSCLITNILQNMFFTGLEQLGVNYPCKLTNCLVDYSSWNEFMCGWSYFMKTSSSEDLNSVTSSVYSRLQQDKSILAANRLIPHPIRVRTSCPRVILQSFIFLFLNKSSLLI